MRQNTLRFSRGESDEFIIELRKRVNDYFTSNNIKKTSNPNMVFKTVFMISLFFVPYAFVVSGLVSNHLLYIILWVLMGLGTSGIGLSIMHDANHGSYSRNKRVNLLLGHLLDFVGGSSRNWRIQHNKLHHTFTNVEGMDEDIKSRVVLRFAPSQKRYRIHRFQFIYAWFLYCLMTIFWVTSKDFMQLARYRKNGLVKKEDYGKLMLELVFWKVFYFAYLLVLPIVFTAVPVYLTIIGFMSMHFISGFILSCIFQPAHVVPETDFPLADEDGMLENNWAVHQLRTTTNFARGSRIFSWFVGGLNYQVEHHLFPNICHVHYKRISRIVEETAREYNLPYHFENTYVGALWNHGRMLYLLGRKDLAMIPAIHA
jgi:linoleoyl-CoA desaturase